MFVVTIFRKKKNGNRNISKSSSSPIGPVEKVQLEGELQPGEQVSQGPRGVVVHIYQQLVGFPSIRFFFKNMEIGPEN